MCALSMTKCRAYLLLNIKVPDSADKAYLVYLFIPKPFFFLK